MPRKEPKLAALRGGLEISEGAADILCESVKVCTAPYFAFLNGNLKIEVTMCDERTLVAIFQLDERQYPDDHGTDQDYIAQPVGWWVYESRLVALTAVQQFIADNIKWGVS